MTNIAIVWRVEVNADHEGYPVRVTEYLAADDEEEAGEVACARVAARRLAVVELHSVTRGTWIDRV